MLFMTLDVYVPKCIRGLDTLHVAGEEAFSSMSPNFPISELSEPFFYSFIFLYFILFFYFISFFFSKYSHSFANSVYL
jgi:hypothetical protein